MIEVLLESNVAIAMFVVEFNIFANAPNEIYITLDSIVFIDYYTLYFLVMELKSEVNKLYMLYSNKGFDLSFASLF